MKSTLCPMPRSAASSIMRTAMSPEPATTNLTFSSFSSTRLAARMKYSGPFCMVMRPRNRTIFSSRSMAMPRLGWTESWSTPLYTTSILFSGTPYRRCTIDLVRRDTAITRSAPFRPARSMS